MGKSELPHRFIGEWQMLQALVFAMARSHPHRDQVAKDFEILSEVVISQLLANPNFTEATREAAEALSAQIKRQALLRKADEQQRN